MIKKFNHKPKILAEDFRLIEPTDEIIELNNFVSIIPNNSKVFEILKDCLRSPKGSELDLHANYR
jgi:hypothetical protein